MTKRLIEEWLPIAELGEESMRERRSMTALPPIYYLHVWWARRPLVASRAAVLASLLPANADRSLYTHLLGIHGDPVSSRKRIDAAKRKGERFEGDAYSYKRAFTYKPTDDERDWLLDEALSLGINKPAVLDPTAGGGAIPFEAIRLGCTTYANDINPVAVLVQKATYEWPSMFGSALVEEYERLCAELVRRRDERLNPYYPDESSTNCISTNYLWARTITCPYCSGLIPLCRDWRLTPTGTGIRLLPQLGHGPGDKTRRCHFEIVHSLRDQSQGTVKSGDATCPFPDCGRIIDGDNVKRQAEDAGLGEQLYAVVFKQKLSVEYTKTGKLKKEKWKKLYRAAAPHDDIAALISAALYEKLPEWEALDVIPTEEIPFGYETNIRWPLHRYGIKKWTDFFSPRQILCHGTSMEVFRELVSEETTSPNGLSDLTRVALAYVALALDKRRDYNSRMTRWITQREVMANTFDRHDFAFKWSYAEMAPLVKGVGYDWAFRQVGKCIRELVELIHSSPSAGSAAAGPLFASMDHVDAASDAKSHVQLSCGSGSSLPHIEKASIDAIVMDPPYYDNVMYAELSDFFYVWLKRSAGPALSPSCSWRRSLTRVNEAVANPARHKGKKGAKALAGLDYQQKMAEIFAECRRVLERRRRDDPDVHPQGHRRLGCPHQGADRCRLHDHRLLADQLQKPRALSTSRTRLLPTARSFWSVAPAPSKSPRTVQYWEDLEPRVKAAVRQRIEQFQDGGIRGVDLYLSCFGPALEEFSTALAHQARPAQAD
jgi:putative DNA methylase